MAFYSDYKTDKTLGRKMDSLSAACLAEVMENPMVMMSGHLSAVCLVLMNLTAVRLDVLTRLGCLLTAVVKDSRKC